MQCKKSLFIAYLILRMFSLHAQEKTKFDDEAFRKSRREFYTKRIGAPFVPQAVWKDINGRTTDLYHTNRPAVVFLGFSTCHPCRKGLPFYAMVAMDKDYGQIDLLYMTFDDSSTVVDEMKASGIALPNNIKVVSVSQKYIDSNKIANEYPVVYFLDKNKIVQDMYGANQANNDHLDSIGYWHAMLNKIK